MGQEEKPVEEKAQETWPEKFVRTGLGVTTFLALFGCGGLLLMVLMLLLGAYLSSLFTGVPFNLE